MTMLHDRLEDAVADVSADLPALTAGSRRQGLAIRRRRRALAAVGSVAAVTVLAVGATALTSGPDGQDPVVATEGPTPTPAALSGRTAPITDTGVVAALADAVDQVADGTVSRFQGYVAADDAQAALLLEPVQGAGPAGQVFVNLQPASVAGDVPYTCAGYLVGSISDCTSRQRPDGSYLRTYRMDDDTEFGRGSQYVAAEVIDPAQHLRVLVSARNGNPWADGEMRAEPVLTLDQLTAIATQAWWSRTDLPVEYVEAGQDIELYQG